MRVGIFYFSRSVTTKVNSGDTSRTNVMLLPHGGVCFVRVEEVEAVSVVDALDMAQPRAGESVLNTEPL